MGAVASFVYPGCILPAPYYPSHPPAGRCSHDGQHALLFWRGRINHIFRGDLDPSEWGELYDIWASEAGFRELSDPAIPTSPLPQFPLSPGETILAFLHPGSMEIRSGGGDHALEAERHPAVVLPARRHSAHHPVYLDLFSDGNREQPPIRPLNVKHLTEGERAVRNGIVLITRKGRFALLGREVSTDNGERLHLHLTKAIRSALAGRFSREGGSVAYPRPFVKFCKRNAAHEKLSHPKYAKAAGDYVTLTRLVSFISGDA